MQTDYQYQYSKYLSRRKSEESSSFSFSQPNNIFIHLSQNANSSISPNLILGLIFPPIIPALSLTPFLTLYILPWMIKPCSKSMILLHLWHNILICVSIVFSPLKFLTNI